MAEKKPPTGYKKTPPPKAPPKTDVPPGYGGGLDTGQTPAPELTPKQKAEAKKLKQKAQAISANYRENNRGGAPVDPAFVLAALQQGLTPNEVRIILNSQALGGPVTGPAYSSTELLEFFKENPENISSLLDAAKSAADAPENYGEYLAGGGVVGGYQSQNQMIQSAVFGIEGAKDAYLAGTTKQKWLDEGNDPAQWYNYKYSQMNEGQNQVPTGPSFIGGFDTAEFDALATDDLGALATTAQQMFAAKQQKEMAQGLYNEPFSIDEIGGGE